jgi:hypothetical protein
MINEEQWGKIIGSGCPARPNVFWLDSLFSFKIFSILFFFLLMFFLFSYLILFFHTVKRK